MSHYFTPKERQRTHCPECGGKLKPFGNDEVFATTEGEGMFWACDNRCEYLELRGYPSV